MKKSTFSVVLIFLPIFLFDQTANDYGKILKGDFSAFAGYWVNGKEDNLRRIYLHSDGVISFEDGDTGKLGGFSKRADGIYQGAIGFYDSDGNPMPGAGIMLFPVGAEGFYGVKTDTTKVRLTMGQEGPSSPDDYYYREAVFPATHMVTENIKLRTDQDLSSSTIKVLEKGTKVQVQRWGNDVTIDGTTAKWAYIYTIDGFAGWCYSGFLQEL
ncbi:MAG: SH3 domain-containing protein [Spirochaetaceae bacterium]|jgi:hypothetical protein|nr:SH3 domain-containing protein [Spirochaetaceae bacterium]